MKTSLQMLFLAIFCLLLSANAMAQPYSINWYKIADGGGTSTGGTYSVSGTIGQHDASGAMSGGSYSLTGGFWSILAVQTPGVPNLVIQYLGPDSVKVSWPDTGSYTLRQNTDLSTTNWTASAYSITTANGTNSVTITPPAGNLFFRLANP
jgi:hypothetical protein